MALTFYTLFEYSFVNHFCLNRCLIVMCKRKLLFSNVHVLLYQKSIFPEMAQYVSFLLLIKVFSIILSTLFHCRIFNFHLWLSIPLAISLTSCDLFLKIYLLWFGELTFLAMFLIEVQNLLYNSIGFSPGILWSGHIDFLDDRHMASRSKMHYCSPFLFSLNPDCCPTGFRMSKTQKP